MTGSEETGPLGTELDRLRAELDSIRTITAALSSKTDLGDMLKETLEVSMGTVGAKAGSILLYDADREELVFQHVVGEKARELTGMGISPERGICGEVYRSGVSKISDDVTKEKSHAADVGRKIRYQTTNMVTVPLRSTEGEPIGVMQILNKERGDFDDRDLGLLTILASQAAMAIETAQLHEEARLAQIVNLMGNISHDIKNFIAPVQTSVQTLALMLESMYAELDELAAEESADRAALVERLQQATEGVREFYPEAADMALDGSLRVQDRVREIADCVKGIVAEPQFELTDVRKVVTAVLRPLSVTANKAQVELTTESPDDVPETLVDRKQLYNAVYNLVNNAIPETEPGGTVAIRTSACIDGQFPDGAYVLIEVADTGRGMPKHVRAKLFTDDVVSTKPGGTGLGTRIVKNVVDAHEGTISVESAEGVGTTFFMKLPYRTELEVGAEA